MTKPGIEEEILSKAKDDKEKKELKAGLSNLRKFGSVGKAASSSLQPRVVNALAAKNIGIRDATKLDNKSLAKVLVTVPETEKEDVRVVSSRFKGADKC